MRCGGVSTCDLVGSGCGCGRWGVEGSRKGHENGVAVNGECDGNGRERRGVWGGGGGRGGGGTSGKNYFLWAQPTRLEGLSASGASVTPVGTVTSLI